MLVMIKCETLAIGMERALLHFRVVIFLVGKGVKGKNRLIGDSHSRLRDTKSINRNQANYLTKRQKDNSRTHTGDV